jgi:hypothetical protein
LPRHKADAHPSRAKKSVDIRANFYILISAEAVGRLFPVGTALELGDNLP